MRSMAAGGWNRWPESFNCGTRSATTQRVRALERTVRLVIGGGGSQAGGRVVCRSRPSWNLVLQGHRAGASSMDGDGDVDDGPASGWWWLRLAPSRGQEEQPQSGQGAECIRSATSFRTRGYGLGQ